MTIAQIIEALNARNNSFGTDFAGHYDISRTEAERIAVRANSLEEFEAIWNNETDWKDAE